MRHAEKTGAPGASNGGHCDRVRCVRRNKRHSTAAANYNQVIRGCRAVLKDARLMMWRRLHGSN